MAIFSSCSIPRRSGRGPDRRPGEVADARPDLTPLNIGVAAYLGVFVTAVGLYLWLYLFRTAPAVVATSVQYLHPIIGILVGAMMFGDRLGLPFGLGVTLILSGLALVVVPARRG